MLSYVLTSGVYFLIPYSSPNYLFLMTLRCLIAVTMAAPIGHPLIADYVKSSDRGKAVALAGVGIVFGEVFAMGILFNFTKNLSYYDAFAVTAFLIFGFSMFFMYSIKEPDFNMIRNDSLSKHIKFMRGVNQRISPTGGRPRSLSQVIYSNSSLEIVTPQKFEHKSTCQKIQELTLIVTSEVVENPLLLICMIGGTITKLISVLFSTYLILWIQTFVTGTSGS